MTRQYVIGTAGHIDHGKTALVKALTGIDTDRLPEEKARGITIDLGFAHLNDNITIIDVPGHERLVKNMVAGVSTIDLMLLVVAADDGVMPQSREHLDIINLLQISHGIVAITKTDLADEEWLLLVEEDVRSLLKGTPFTDAPVLRTSAASGAGITALKAEILQRLKGIPPRREQEIFRQPVDRVFSAKGFGTVITGTVLSGSIRQGDEIEIQPTALRARIRGLQSHDSPVDSVHTGDRAAVNLAGIDHDRITRGMTLTAPQRFAPVKMINARLNLLASSPIPLKNNQRIRIHIHTAEAFARVLIPDAPRMQPGASAMVQLRLESPVHAAFQDRFIIRQFSPQRTIGGGVILQVNPVRYRKKHAEIIMENLELLESDEPESRVQGAFDRIDIRPLTLWELKTATNIPLSDLQKQLKKLQAKRAIMTDNQGRQTVYFSARQLSLVLQRVQQMLYRYHQRHPGRPGLKESEMVSQLERWYLPEAIRKSLQLGLMHKNLVLDGTHYRDLDFTPQLSAKDSEVYAALERRYREAGFVSPTVKEAMAEFALSQKDFKELSRMLREAGKLVVVDANLMFHSSIFPELRSRLLAYFQDHPFISVPEFKELIGSTRKHAIPLLEYLDKQEVTLREGDLRRRGTHLH